MAETQIQTPQKRPREEKSQDDCSFELDGSSGDSKRQKPCNNILNHLNDEEEEVEPIHELGQDLSAIFTTLEQELPSFGFPTYTAASEAEVSELDDRHITSAACDGDDEDDGLKLSVMRHLLEASDDELGIPNRSTDEINSEILKSGENFSLAFNDHDGLWGYEDEAEAANYYAIFQSELFM